MKFRHTEKGMALIITLMMLAIVTFMAVIFLAMSRRERTSVKIVEEQNTARAMADSGSARASADVVATMNRDADAFLFGPTRNGQRYSTNDIQMMISNGLIQRGKLHYGLRPSRSYSRPGGFKAADGTNAFNVSYYRNTGPGTTEAIAYGSAEYMQSMANMQYDAQAPVWENLGTSRAKLNFYLDLNRNGVFEDNWYHDYELYDRETLRNPTRFSGDPEWIGVLERPDMPHGENNRFIGRYAYLVLPMGKSLDINFIHNLADGGDDSFGTSTGSKYSRNWGVGSWELNMAGFLVDFHKGLWRPTPAFYDYDSTGAAGGTAFAARGTAFQSARGILGYRLKDSRANLYTPQEIFRQLQSDPSLWTRDYVDMHGDGRFVNYHDWYKEVAPIRNALLIDQDLPGRAWFGADQPARTGEYSDIQRPFSIGTGYSGDFTRFYNAFIRATSMTGNTNSNYDRYGYYRWIAQMGADSVPALNQKIHLNYLNEPGTLSTNLQPWFETNSMVNGLQTIAGQPAVIERDNGGSLTNFFLITADAMLKRALVTNVFIDEYRVWRTNYTIGGTYFTDPSLNTRPEVQRLIANFPVRKDISITNIQIYHEPITNMAPRDAIRYRYVTNAEYSSAVHRVLQLAANLYDNMTNAGPQEPYFPSVWRPLFSVTPTNVLISGYVFSPRAQDFPPAQNWTTEESLLRQGPGFYPNVYVWGQASVIGAKKGWPNFNELSMETYAQVGRKLQLVKSQDLSQLRETNQIISLGISNVFGVELWNSYSRDFRRPITIQAMVVSDVSLDTKGTNQATQQAIYTNVFRLPTKVMTNQPFVVNFWKGRKPKDEYTDRSISMQANTPADSVQSDFRLPLYTNVLVMPNVDWTGGPPAWPYYFRTNVNNNYGVGDIFTKGLGTPHFVLKMTNHFRYIATVDNGRIVDFVTLRGLSKSLDITAAMGTQTNTANVAFANTNAAAGRFWSMERLDKTALPEAAPATVGHLNQLLVSMGLQPIDDETWRSWNSTWTGDKPGSIARFQQWLSTLANPPVEYQETSTTTGNNNQQQNQNQQFMKDPSMQVPFSPVRTLWFYTRYQVNDPLVHYMADDLRDRYPLQYIAIKPGSFVKNEDFGGVNVQKYSPWGRGIGDMHYKDARIFSSDDWAFPIAKLDNPDVDTAIYGIPNFHYRYANIGQIGRVHRGTPWQTFYLKSGTARMTNQIVNGQDVVGWSAWSGSFGTHPNGDWKLIDLFTTAMTENAARGLLSVNQTNIAAWSALLSGVQVITNSVPNNEYKEADNRAIPPRYGVPTGAGEGGPDLLVQPGSIQLTNIVQGINNFRATRPLGVFGYMGEILGTPELTMQSPYLNRDNWQYRGNAFTDDVIEAIPQRVMSLLKEDEPRMVIYAFGQTLKPAPRSLATSGNFYNLPLNYQVSGEYATKTIIRVEGELRNPNNPLRTVVESYEQLPPFD